MRILKKNQAKSFFSVLKSILIPMIFFAFQTSCLLKDSDRCANGDIKCTGYLFLLFDHFSCNMRDMKTSSTLFANIDKKFSVTPTAILIDMDKKGNYYLASSSAEEIIQMTPDGTSKVLVNNGSATQIVAFSVKEEDEFFYVTNGSTAGILKNQRGLSLDLYNIYPAANSYKSIVVQPKVIVLANGSSGIPLIVLNRNNLTYNTIPAGAYTYSAVTNRNNELFVLEYDGASSVNIKKGDIDTQGFIVQGTYSVSGASPSDLIAGDNGSFLFKDTSSLVVTESDTAFSVLNSSASTIGGIANGPCGIYYTESNGSNIDLKVYTAK